LDAKEMKLGCYSGYGAMCTFVDRNRLFGGICFIRFTDGNLF